MHSVLFTLLLSTRHDKKPLRWVFAFVLITLLLGGCNPPPVTQPPPTPCPWWGCGTGPIFSPTSTPTQTLKPPTATPPTTLPPTDTPVPPTATPPPTLPPTNTPVPPVDAGGTLTCTYRVSARDHSTARQYFDTGIDIQQGANLIIDATGTACFGLEKDHCNGPDGHPAFDDTDLVGKIGGGDMFHIGSSFQKAVSETGKLYLGFNDTDYDNNSGFFEVTVTVTNTLTETCNP